MGEFGEFFTETVTIERATGRDGWGDTTYAAATSITARVERDRREILSDTAETVASQATLFTEDKVGEGDLVTITIDGVDRKYTIQTAMKHFDLEGVFSHYEAML